MDVLRWFSKRLWLRLAFVVVLAAPIFAAAAADAPSDVEIAVALPRCLMVPAP